MSKTSFQYTILTLIGNRGLAFSRDFKQEAINLVIEQRYGSVRIHKKLLKQSESIGRNRVIRLMQKNSLKAVSTRKFKQTTDSSHGQPVARNQLQQNFMVDSPNTVWAGDISYIATNEGWLYLAVVIDLHSRKVIG